MELAPGEDIRDPHVIAGLASGILDTLNELVDAVDRQSVLLDLDAFEVLVWGAPRRWASYEHRRLWKGLAVFNLDAVNDLFVGFAADKAQAAPGSAQAGAADLVISPRGFLQLPFLGSHVSCGSVGAGPAIVCPLSYAPILSGGRF